MSLVLEPTTNDQPRRCRDVTYVLSREYGETRTGDEEVPERSEVDALCRPLLSNMAAVSAL